jgi:hypothetical protein
MKPKQLVIEPRKEKLNDICIKKWRRQMNEEREEIEDRRKFCLHAAGLLP